MAALVEHDEMRCECGGDVRETTATESKGAYRALPPLRCHQCTERERAAEQHKDEPFPAALRIPISKVKPRAQGPRRRVEVSEAAKAGMKRKGPAT